ncbi:MAG: VCBS repeat-containing protein [Verrucomicrobiota bacterium]|nr:VCBS repeat-containing protein [Verrucomicrobiota bacterium]
MTNYAVGRNPAGVVVGDWNGDGKLDVAVANFGSGTVTVRLGLGDGFLGGASHVSVGGGAVGLAAGHLNGDGRLDLVVVNYHAQTLSVLWGLGMGRLWWGLIMVG